MLIYYLFTAAIVAYGSHVCAVQALPPVASLYLSKEEIKTYGKVHFFKSEDVYFSGLGWTLPISGKSFIRLEFELERKLDCSYFLDLDETTDEQMRIALPSQIQIIVNGQLIERETSYSERQIDITAYLKEGLNTLQIELFCLSPVPYTLCHLGVKAQFNPFD